MTNLRVGDKVMITDVSGIMFGRRMWKDHDVTEVMEIQTEGDLSLRITNAQVISEGTAREVDGVPVFTVATCEFHCLAKLIPVNAEPAPIEEFAAGTRVFVQDTSAYFGSIPMKNRYGTVKGPAREFGHSRGELLIDLDNYVSLSFNREELEEV